MPETINYDDSLTVRSFEARIEGVEYTVTEASGEEANVYRDERKKAVKVENGVVSYIKNIDTLRHILIQQCTRVKATSERVKTEVVKKWPNRVQADLFRRIELMSGLDNEMTELIAQIKGLMDKTYGSHQYEEFHRACLSNTDEEFSLLRAVVKSYEDRPGN